MKKIIISGFVGKDAVIQNSNGLNYVNFPLAYSENRKQTDETWERTTEWYWCSKIVGEKSTLVGNIKKGTLLNLVGGFSSRINQYEGKSEIVTNIHVDVIDFLPSTGKDKKECEPTFYTPEDLLKEDAQNTFIPAEDEQLPF